MSSNTKIVTMVEKTIDKHQFKITVATAIVVLIFIVTMSVQFATWKTQMQNEHQAMTLRQDHLSNGHASLRDSIEDLERRQDLADVTTARIETKLASIESLLIEIKADLKSHDQP